MPSKRPMPPSRRIRRRLLLAALLLLPSAGLDAQPHEQDPPAPPQSPAPAPEFGAIAFTADGSFAAAWKHASKGEVEAKVLADCVRFRRGKCQVVGFREELCTAIASFRTAKALKATYAGGGVTRADAQRSALERCNGDRRARGTCQLRTVVCGNGR